MLKTAGPNHTILLNNLTKISDQKLQNQRTDKGSKIPVSQNWKPKEDKISTYLIVFLGV